MRSSSCDLAMFAATGAIDPTALARAKMLSSIKDIDDLPPSRNGSTGRSWMW